MNTAYAFLRGARIGPISIALFYLFYIASWFIPGGLFFLILLFFCIVNGFFIIKTIYMEKTTWHKIFSFSTGFISVVFFLTISLRLQFPDIFADYFIYGEGGGGLEPGGWFAFNLFTLIYFAVTAFIFILGMILRKK